MIDRKYFELDLTAYYRDLLLALAAFAAGFAGCLYGEGLVFVLAFLVATVALHRAAFFIHEITHQSGNFRLRTFTTVWDLTVGALTLVPSARFIRPHLTHHTAGIFRTKDDPQYLLMRNNLPIFVLIMILVPPIMPVLSVIQMLTCSFGGIAAEEAVERFLMRRDVPTGSVLPQKYRSRVAWLSRYYLVLWAAYVYLFPETLLLHYAIVTGVWYLTTWRIPLEHRMERRLEASDKQDQIEDSFTVEWPLAWLLQPIGLQFHTAHHMYPGVPYHHLPALHAELKATDPDYRRNVVSIWDVVRGIPERAPTSGTAR
ncbi:fatty acid desaturase family protein [Thalassobaculum sp.]|uniref:fatty acid desaturase family protein n=1 Tax=Thalassobaculum sp. TaxID=2022740 RepID=UPI003B5A284A